MWAKNSFSTPQYLLTYIPHVSIRMAFTEDHRLAYSTANLREKIWSHNCPGLLLAWQSFTTYCDEDDLCITVIEPNTKQSETKAVCPNGSANGYDENKWIREHCWKFSFELGRRPAVRSRRQYLYCDELQCCSVQRSFAPSVVYRSFLKKVIYILYIIHTYIYMHDVKW